MLLGRAPRCSGWVVALKYKKLNPLFVNLSHPDGLMALLSGQQVTASFLAPPFQYRALEKGMHKVLSSYDIMGGPASFLCVWTKRDPLVDPFDKLCPALMWTSRVRAETCRT